MTRVPLPWTMLPATLRYPLLTGAAGKSHLLRLGRQAIALSQNPDDISPALAHLAREFHLAAWLSDPLDAGPAGELLACERAFPFLSQATIKCLKAVSAMHSGRGPAERLARLESEADPARLLDYLSRERSADPGNGPIARALYHHACAHRDFSRVQTLLGGLERHAAFAPALPVLRGQAHFLEGGFAESFEQYANAEQFFPGFFLDRAGEALVQAGRADEGLARMRSALAVAPWRINCALRLHDLATGTDDATASLDGKVAVLLYSYNNPERLDETLASLFASDRAAAAQVRVHLLINGRSEASEAVAAKWKERFGPSFESISLPVNIGAAPARNWLMHLDAVRACDFAAYLDDDVSLPPDWLGRFGAAIKAYPRAGLWGCKVLDFQTPAVMQQTDLNLLAPRDAEPLFSLSDAQADGFDLRQFSYLRPCASVTGCCHIFRTESLHACGDFDIRFAPTQYDDLDHDLRLNLAGIDVVYQGHLAVTHKNRSGKSMRRSNAASANAAANMYKLKSKYAQADVAAIQSRMASILEADLLAKLDRLDRSLLQ